MTWAHDVFGNAVATATFQAMTDSLEIDSVSELQLDAAAWPVSSASQPRRSSTRSGIPTTNGPTWALSTKTAILGPDGTAARLGAGIRPRAID